MIPLHRGYSVHYWLVVGGDREFKPGLPPSFDEARRTLRRLAHDDHSRRNMRRVLASDFGCYDLFRYDDDQVLDMLAQHIAFGRAQLYEEEQELPARSAVLPVKVPEKRRTQVKEELTWIEVVLVDEADNPVPGARYEISRAKGSPVSSGALDGQGLVRVAGIKPGPYKVGFPELDEEFWVTVP